jgi:hypothetical protein
MTLPPTDLLTAIAQLEILAQDGLKLVLMVPLSTLMDAS